MLFLRLKEINFAFHSTLVFCSIINNFGLSKQVDFTNNPYQCDIIFGGYLMWKFPIIVVICACISLEGVLAHSGGTDKYGCHAGSELYHCHDDKTEASWESILGGLLVMGLLLAMWAPKKEKPATIFEEIKDPKPKIFFRYEKDQFRLKWVPFSW